MEWNRNMIIGRVSNNDGMKETIRDDSELKCEWKWQYATVESRNNTVEKVLLYQQNNLLK